MAIILVNNTTGETKSVPLPPEISAIEGGFTIRLLPDWTPSNILGWTLQRQQSTNNDIWTEWEYVDSVQATEHGYVDVDVELGLYYKYRYQIETPYGVSEWSNDGYAGRVFDATSTSNLIDPNREAVNELSAITANLGWITAGTVTGGTIQTAEPSTNPRMWLDQTGLKATNSSGGTILNYDTATGDLTLTGDITTGATITGSTITGGIIQTALSGSRIVIDSAGLRAYDTDGTTENLDFDTATGNIFLRGQIITETGSSIDPDFLSRQLLADDLNIFVGGGNLISDSSFEESGIPKWNLYRQAGANPTLEQTTIVARFGNSSAKLTADGLSQYVGVVVSAGARVPVKENQEYVATGYALSDSVSRNFNIIFAWYGPSGHISSSSGSSKPSSITEWTRSHPLKVTAPAGATSVAVYLTFYGTPPAGEIHYVDGMQIEEGDTPTAYAPKVDEILPGTVTSTELANLSVTSGKLVDGSVLNAKLGNLSVSLGKIQDGAVTDVKIDSVSAVKISGQLTNAQIAALDAAKLTGQITETQISDDAITTPKIFAGAVTSAEIAANTIVAGNIATDTITATQIAANAVTASEINASAVTAAKIASNAVTTIKLNALAVTADKIAANTITAAKIAANTITANEIAVDTITANEIAAGAISASELAADSVTANKILAGEITAGHIAANTFNAEAVVAAKFTAGVINADRITANSITSGQIYAGTVQTDLIQAGNVAANAINAGHINATLITATEVGEIRGPLIRTAATGSRVELSTSGLKAYDSVGNLKLDYNIGTGALAMNGSITIASGSSGLGNVSGTLPGAQVGTGVSATNVTTGTLPVNQVPGLPTSKITSGQFTGTFISDSAITTPKLFTGAVTAAKIYSGTVEADKIQAGNIAADAITADHINVTTLTATEVGVIQGPTLQTAASGKRVVIDSSGLSAYADDGSTELLNYDITAGSLKLIDGKILLGSNGYWETSETHPKVRGDSTGVYSTDSSGAKLAQLAPNQPKPRADHSLGAAAIYNDTAFTHVWVAGNNGFVPAVGIPAGRTLEVLAGHTFYVGNVTNDFAFRLRLHIYDTSLNLISTPVIGASIVISATAFSGSFPITLLGLYENTSLNDHYCALYLEVRRVGGSADAEVISYGNTGWARFAIL